MAAPSKPQMRWWRVIPTLMLAGIAWIFFMIPGPVLEKTHASEMAMLKAELGEDAYELMQGWVDKWFKLFFEDTGAVQASENYFQENKQPRDPFNDKGLGAWVKKRTEVFWQGVRYGLYRWGMLVLWLPLIIVAAVPVSLDAGARRNILKYKFRYSSPMKHKNSLKFMRVLMLFIFLAPLAWFPLPPLTIPGLMLLWLGAWWVFWANMQKRL